MRIGTLLLIIWLVIGAIAGGQRHYYNGSVDTCAKAGNIALTIVAGPPRLTVRRSISRRSTASWAAVP